MSPDKYDRDNRLSHSSEPGEKINVEIKHTNQIEQIIAQARSVLTSVISTMIVGIFGPVMIAAGKLKQPRSNRIASWIHQHTWSIPTLKLANIKLQVEGLENIQNNSAHIIASNHQGLLDNLAIPAALAQKALGMSFIAKKQLLKIPIFGKAIEALGVPAIDKGNSEEAKKSLNETTKIIRENELNVIWYPEGTRTEDGTLGKFKKGFAYMAISSGAPVIPTCITGSFECMPKGSKLAKPGTITVKFGEPIDTSDMSIDNKKDIDDLVKMTEQKIIEMRNQ